MASGRVIDGNHSATWAGSGLLTVEHVSKKFDLPWVFLDHPTGL